MMSELLCIASCISHQRLLTIDEVLEEVMQKCAQVLADVIPVVPAQVPGARVVRPLQAIAVATVIVGIPYDI